MKFLHISDVHLGCTRYNLPESPGDFYKAWKDVIEKYAIGESVDFVVIGGDFFHKRNVDPQAMNHAMVVLRKLKEANIPVVVIEGNHDQHYNDIIFSWLRSLSAWDLIKLLEPSVNKETGDMDFTEWNQNSKTGSFIDIKEARIFGSHWFGTSANSAIPMMTDLIKQNSRPGAFQILLLHTDVEGHQTHPIPALTVANLKELKSVTNYVGLGHTHMCYEIDNWAFNPGSLEVTNIDEYQQVRGAWLVKVDSNLEISAEHVKDYRQRPFQRLKFEVTGCLSAESVVEKVKALVEANCTPYSGSDESGKPIIELAFRGKLGFPNSLLNLKGMSSFIQTFTNALHVRIKNQTSPVEYDISSDDGQDISRDMLEKQVVEKLVYADIRYKSNYENIADAVIGAKKMALQDDSPESIAEFISNMLKEQSAGVEKQIQN